MQSENAHGYVICPDVTRGKSKKVIKSNPFPQGNDNCDISAFIRKQIDSCSTSVYVALIPFGQINANYLHFDVTDGLWFEVKKFDMFLVNHNHEVNV